VRHLVPELAKFGVVGATGAVVDLGGSALLYGTFHFGPLKAKAIAITAACVVTYLGSRYWTFRHRENQPLWRELGLFILLNGIGLFIAEAVIAITAYAFGSRDQVAYNLASVIGTGLGTIFRFWAYRKWVFLAPLVPNEPVVPAPQAPALAVGRSFQPVPGSLNGTANGNAHGIVNRTVPGAFSSAPNGSTLNGSTPNGSVNGTARSAANGASRRGVAHAPGRHRKTR
jgi:putative flippase GtrA